MLLHCVIGQVDEIVCTHSSDWSEENAKDLGKSNYFAGNMGNLQTPMLHEQFEQQNVANSIENERFELQNAAKAVEMAASSSKMLQIERKRKVVPKPEK